MKRLLRLRRPVRDEQGFTIVELSMAMLIMSIVLVLAFDFLDRASLLTIRTQANAETEQSAQMALRVLTEEVRGALPIGDPCSPTDDSPTASVPGQLPPGYQNCMKFSVKRTEAGVDTCPESRFIFALVGNGTTKKLIENRTDYSRVGATCTATVVHTRRVHLEKVVNATTQPLFRYFSVSGAEIAPSDTAAIKKASSVRATVSVKFHGNANPSVFSSSAALRNNISR